MNDAKNLEDQVYAEWLARPESLRTQNYTESFYDETWSSGQRLHKHRPIHDQSIMAIIRPKIINC